MSKTGKWQWIKGTTGTVRVGMWTGDDSLYFSTENLKPEDFVDSDTHEFGILIEDLARIVEQARRIRKGK